jgi:hypothetical protein
MKYQTDIYLDDVITPESTPYGLDAYLNEFNLLGSGEAMTLSFAFAVRDSYRSAGSKIGDVIAVRPTKWIWGTEERKRFLIVEINIVGTSNTNVARILTVPVLSNGAFRNLSDEDQTVGVTVVNKRRLQFTQTTINAMAASVGITINWAQLQDPKITYQPFDGKVVTYASYMLDKYLAVNLTAAQIGALG